MQRVVTSGSQVDAAIAAQATWFGDPKDEMCGERVAVLRC